MTGFKFLQYRNIAYGLSALIILVSLLALIFRGLNLGLDFTGGTLYEVKFEKEVQISELRKTIKEKGIKGFVLQETKEGTFIVKVKAGEQVEKLEEIFKKFGEYDLIRKEKISGVVSDELRRKAVFAILTALAGILIYLGMRFQPIWGLGAILALTHDVLAVLGAYSITYREVNLEVVSAILIVAGYSVADTVVIFDRIRENLRKKKGFSLEEIVNISINQTLSRTIITSLTTLVTALTLFILGGYGLSNIMFAFVVGVIVGTYSSVFVASASVLDIVKLFKRKEVITT
ncbi:MAG TPA: protein translocase subunit SecF [Aquifex aeolicus]|nr:protein translocase subunit SecF [Aquifex aeolicus]